MRIAIASDHGGFELKQHLVDWLGRRPELEIEDLGTETAASVDYPDFAAKVTDRLRCGEADLGILICGTGIGMSIAANRARGVRAALCLNGYMAAMARRHNHANLLALGGRVIGFALAEGIVDAFLTAEPEGGRHRRRVDKIEAL